MASEHHAAVTVIGGGPAGAVTAMLLRRLDISVLVLERGWYGDRSAIDVLTPEIRVELSRLGIWDRFTAADPTPCHAIQSAWGDDGVRERHFIRNPHGCGWSVRRCWLDSLLAHCARDAGAIFLTHARPVRVARAGAEWRLHVETPSGAFTARSDFLVDASGAGAALARMLGARRRTLDRMIGLSRLFAGQGVSSDPDPVLLLESHPLGWWYSVHTDDRAVLVTLLTGGATLRGTGDARLRAWNLALAGTQQTRRRIEQCGASPVLKARAADVGCLDRAVGDGWLAVGDAASTFDPLSGTGVRKALVEAQRAAKAIRATLSGATEALPAYGAAVARSFEWQLRKRDEHYGRERRWQNAAFWSARSRPV